MVGCKTGGAGDGLQGWQSAASDFLGSVNYALRSLPVLSSDPNAKAMYKSLQSLCKSLHSLWSNYMLITCLLRKIRNYFFFFFQGIVSKLVCYMDGWFIPLAITLIISFFNIQFNNKIP